MNDNTLDILLAHRKEPNITNNDIKKKFKHLLKTHYHIKDIRCLATGNIINHVSYKSNKLALKSDIN